MKLLSTKHTLRIPILEIFFVFTLLSPLTHAELKLSPVKILSIKANDQKPTLTPDENQAKSWKKRLPHLSTSPNGILITPRGAKINTYLALEKDQQIRGLSGILPQNFKNNEGVLFFYSRKEKRQFWMPNTFFDLDVFFLDNQFKIIHITRNLKKHEGIGGYWNIPKTPVIEAFHVLEMKAQSPLGEKLKVGDHFTWAFQMSPQQIRLSTLKEK